jgi:hypothetical protein
MRSYAPRRRDLRLHRVISGCQQSPAIRFIRNFREMLLHLRRIEDPIAEQLKAGTTRTGLLL